MSLMVLVEVPPVARCMKSIWASPHIQVDPGMIRLMATCLCGRWLQAVAVGMCLAAGRQLAIGSNMIRLRWHLGATTEAGHCTFAAVAPSCEQWLLVCSHPIGTGSCRDQGHSRPRGLFEDPDIRFYLEFKCLEQCLELVVYMWMPLRSLLDRAIPKILYRGLFATCEVCTVQYTDMLEHKTLCDSLLCVPEPDLEEVHSGCS